MSDPRDLREYFPAGRPRCTIRYQGKIVGTGAFRQFEPGLVQLVGLLNITDPRFPYKGNFNIAMRLRIYDGIAVVVRLDNGAHEDHYGKLKIEGAEAQISVTLFGLPMVCRLSRNGVWSDVKIEAPGIKAEVSLVPITVEAEIDLPADLVFDPATMLTDEVFALAEETVG